MEIVSDNIQKQLAPSLRGQVPPHTGDQNLEMAPPSKKRLIINKKLTKYVRLEQSLHGPCKMIVKEPRSPWKIIEIPNVQASLKRLQDPESPSHRNGPLIVRPTAAKSSEADIGI